MTCAMPTELEIKQEQLASVRAAIQKIEEHGQAYMIQDGGAQRQLTRANLKQLYAREAALERQVSRLAGGGVGVTYGVSCR